MIEKVDDKKKRLKTLTFDKEMITFKKVFEEVKIENKNVQKDKHLKKTFEKINKIVLYCMVFWRFLAVY